MNSKKIVKIELKNPALRRIRRNFRDVIELAVKQEASRLYAISRVYRKRSRESKDPAEKERLERKDDKFMDKGSKLKELLSKSIIQCRSRGGCISYSEATKHGLYPKKVPTNLDMAWMPSYHAWFCTKCCVSLIEEDKLLRKEKHPDHIRWLRDRSLL